MGLKFKLGDKVVFDGGVWTVVLVDGAAGRPVPYMLQLDSNGCTRWTSEDGMQLVETPFDFSESMKALELLAEIVDQSLRNGLTDSAKLLRDGALELVLIRLSQLPGDLGKLASAALRIGRTTGN